MRGHARRRGESWAFVYDEPRQDGKRVQRWRSGFATRKEAQAFLATTVSALGDGSYVQPSKLTFGAYLEDWLEEIADTVKPSTSKRYREIAKRHLIPRLGRVPLQGMKRGHLTTLHRELREAGLAPATIAMTHAVVHRALKDAVASDLVVRNVASTVKGPRPGASKARSWSACELRTFLECVAGDRLFALWRLAAMTGMRRGELLGLTWRTLDLEAGSLVVEQQLVPTPGGVTFAEPKTIRVHGLRHTAATLMLTSGGPVHVVAARIGDRPETLLSVYSHLLPTSDAEAAGRIAALV